MPPIPVVDRRLLRRLRLQSACENVPDASTHLAPRWHADINGNRRDLLKQFGSSVETITALGLACKHNSERGRTIVRLGALEGRVVEEGRVPARRAQEAW